MTDFEQFGKSFFVFLQRQRRDIAKTLVLPIFAIPIAFLGHWDVVAVAIVG